MERSPVTVLGLGAMGHALAAAFLAAGHSTTVWNRTPGRADDLVGARLAPSARDAVAAGPLVVVCLLDADVVSATLADVGDAITGRTVVDLTNSTPARARARAVELAGRGADHLDGGIMAVPPMIGGAHARILCSGPSAVFAAAADTLSALGEVRHLGADPGAASLHDVALLSAMYGTFGGALHAFSLVRAAGHDADDLLGLLTDWLRAMLTSLPAMAAEIDHGPVGPARSPLAMQAAGVANLLATAHDVGIDDRLLAPMGDLLDEAVATGHGDRDIAVLAELLT